MWNTLNIFENTLKPLPLPSADFHSTNIPEFFSIKYIESKRRGTRLRRYNWISLISTCIVPEPSTKTRTHKTVWFLHQILSIAMWAKTPSHDTLTIVQQCPAFTKWSTKTHSLQLWFDDDLPWYKVKNRLKQIQYIFRTTCVMFSYWRLQTNQSTKLSFDHHWCKQNDRVQCCDLWSLARILVGLLVLVNCIHTYICSKYNSYCIFHQPTLPEENK